MASGDVKYTLRLDRDTLRRLKKIVIDGNYGSVQKLVEQLVRDFLDPPGARTELMTSEEQEAISQTLAVLRHGSANSRHLLKMTLMMVAALTRHEQAALEKSSD